mmetsp:Transcript_40620/g.91210  ORF Transcript_40620/g.91210 Transcript_40620/m.91210 type:complete len:1406 (+) Transcript_40620:175-4392(+)
MEHLVSVRVHGVAGITFAEDSGDNPSPLVSVTVFDETQKTHYATATSAATFAYAFSFTRRMKSEDFLKADVQVAVMHAALFRNEPLGDVVISIRQIYDRPGHFISRDWFPIALKDQPGEARGFVELTIGAYGPGDEVAHSSPGLVEKGKDGDDAGSLKSRVVVLPSLGTARSLYHLCVRVYKATNLRKVAGVISNSCNPYVQVDFGGLPRRTAVSPNTTAPVWNQELKIPFIMPSWDDSVNVSLKSGETLLGEVLLHIGQFSTQDLPPTWYNFYCQPDRGFFSGPQEDAVASVYGGRLLLSAGLQRTEKATVPEPSGLPTVEGAPQSAHVLWVDLYQVVFESSDAPKDTFLTLAMEPFLQECELPHPKHCHESAGFAWEGQTGRIEEKALDIPPISMCSDIIISAFSKTASGDSWFKGVFESGATRHMFCRISAKQVANWDVKPRWIEMKSVTGGGKHNTAGFILLSVNLGSKRTKPKRPGRLSLKLQPYTFRAYIHQAANLPCSDKEGSADPMVMLFFGSTKLKTTCHFKTLNPSWNQMLEAQVEMPDEEVLRPDILIYVLDQDERDVAALASCRYATSTKGALPQRWSGPPRWINMEQAPDGPVTQARLLVAFEAFPTGADGKRPSSLPMSASPPNLIECRVELFVVGLRMRTELLAAEGIPLSSPRLEVAWGRQANGSDPIKNKFTEIGTGGDGQYNFLQKISLNCTLSKDPTFQDWIEISLLSDPGGEHMVSVAFANIHLTPHMPWLTATQKAKLKNDFRIKRQEELQVEADRREFHKGRQSLDPTAKKKAKKRQKAAQDDGPAPTVIGHQEEDEEKEGAEGGMDPHQLARNAAGKLQTAKQRPKELPEGLLEDMLGEALAWNSGSITAANTRMLETSQFANIGAAENRRCQESMQASLLPLGPENLIAPVLGFQRNFNWPQRSTEGDLLHKHPDLDDELEDSLLPNSGLPWEKTPVFVGTDFQDQKYLGELKFLCRVVEKDRHKAGGPQIEEEARQWEAQIADIVEKFKASKQLVVRAYILSADGLLPVSGSSDVSTYIWCKLTTDETDHEHSIRDQSSVRKHTLHPEFNKTQVFQKVQLPEHNLLQVSVMEVVPAGFVSAGGENVIGSTTIDLEDRWFQQKYKQMVESGTVPIESRGIRSPDSAFIKGHVRLWVDVMSAMDIDRLKVHPLPDADPLPFQLRVVIWKVTSIIVKEGVVPDLYVQGRHELDNGDVLTLSTDVHNSADDFCGTFNWRFLFDIWLPCRDPRLVFQVWDHNLLEASDSIAEVALDLSKDFRSARKENQSVDIPRGTVALSHPAYPGEVKGYLELQAVLMPMEEAMSRPVGAGREDPNEDPFCDPDDEHLVKHRGLVKTMEFLNNAAYYGKALLVGGMLTTIIYGVVSAVGGLIFTGLTLYVTMS